MTLLELGGSLKFGHVHINIYIYIHTMYVSIWVYIKCPKPWTLISSQKSSLGAIWACEKLVFSDKNQRPKVRVDMIVCLVVDRLAFINNFAHLKIEMYFRRILYHIDGLYVFSLWCQSWSQKALYRKPRGAGARVEKTLLRIRPWQSDKRDADVSKRHGDA